MIKYLTSGESHGEMLVGILEGIPSNLIIDEGFINLQLSLRQSGFGRGDRMKIEKDTIKIVSGVRAKYTTGAPIGLIIKNSDHDNWKNIIGTNATKQNERKITSPRPGHADLSGMIKYNQTDARNILERASARSSAMLVAIGAICKMYLQKLGIEISSEIISVKGETNKDKIKAQIEKAKLNGDTLGCNLAVYASGVPAGFGGCFSSLDRLEHTIMGDLGAIQSVKSVSIGKIDSLSNEYGSNFHDALYINENKKIFRKTNNAGGIEGGISNGEKIEIFIKLKPIPSVPKGIASVDIEKMAVSVSDRERGDACVPEAACIVLENTLAISLAKVVSLCLGGDSIEEVEQRMTYKRRTESKYFGEKK